ncbi:ABC transporter substrate-binding protein [Bacillus sp. DTU_2020_1000418_1_SI_GHA_SEK_038]|uniref:ABC transporter substrate-binding protein n=1 Tax=Bacillus sp. DTU_2020_1000418_1_SI_GHA_SEK_038 TaxID=3077585 RepID=UPI0028E642C9|nr:ABC transporter substrate-binding protein [Bacillus sp. DTU_2020_1000418_1_SI_GHA_SEK_038]WNS77483.1 ABC transporter substrate-binding protein [Bacillus sp. DTU_2020_1000418_1_SI_GHA_SEK_038]
MKRTPLVHLLIIIIVIMLAGCNTGKNEASNGDQKKELEDISIMLDWYPNAVHSAIYVAKEKGYFEDEGLNVKIEMPADTNDPLKLAATGKVDLAISYQSQLLVSRAEGIPVVSIAAFVRHSLDAIMYKTESGIQSPKDLEGKNVGYPSASVSEAVVASMVENDGGDMNKVKMTDVGWDLMASLATDNVDALIGAYINHEQVLLQKEGYNINVLRLPDFGVPDNYELIIVTGEKTLEKKKASFEKFWRAVTKGHEDVKQNPDAGLKVLLDHENDSFPLDAEVEKKSLEVLLPLMDDENAPFGYQDEAVWQEVADWLYESKVINEQVDPKTAFENIVSE